MRRPRFDKTNTLAAYWSKRENDVEVWYPDGKWNAALLFSYFDGRGVTDKHGNPIKLWTELERRGYDPKTLRFTIALAKVRTPDGGGDHGG